jgi:cysteine desulfurase
MSERANLYFDYQASTPLDPQVAKRVLAVSVEEFGNPHADDHATGWSARAIVDHARQQIAEAIGALAHEVFFTSGATEADNLGVLGAALGAPNGRRRILVSAIEHKAVLESASAATDRGYVVELIPVCSNGIVDLEWLRQAVAPDVAVVSIMAVNNEIGTLQPIADAAKIVSSVGAFFHTDATQAPAAMSVDAFDWGVDAASFSSHKVYGPKGVGALYVSSTAPWRPRPLMFGGGQEGGLRPGTLPTALCAGFGLAMTLFSPQERAAVTALRDRLFARLSTQVDNLCLTAAAAPRHPGCLHVRFPTIDAKELVTRLQPQLSVSTGSACTSGVMTTSHVLLAMGLSEMDANSGVRFSLGRFTTDEEIEEAVTLVASAISKIGDVAAPDPVVNQVHANAGS